MNNAYQPLHASPQELAQAREDERRHIARELHDDFGQRLAAMKMDLTSLMPSASVNHLDERITGIINMLDDMVESLRRITCELRPQVLEQMSFVGAIDKLVRQAAQCMDIPIDLTVDAQAQALPDVLANPVYRTLQESLTNIFRHAQATRATVSLQRLDGHIVLTVQDNGIGLPEQAPPKDGSNGLSGMAERARLLGGSLNLSRAQEGGVRVSLSLPLARHPL